jgi:hypothetical protein
MASDQQKGAEGSVIEVPRRSNLFGVWWNNLGEEQQMADSRCRMA